MNKLNYKIMSKLFRENNFSKYGFKRYKTKNNRFYWFKDNGADILAVAHLDSIQKPSHFKYVKVDNDETFIFSPVLDDRLGVYVITDYLIKEGLKYDILLTTDEEKGQTTAQFFETTKQYKWGFSFDRTGDDVVLYKYDTPIFSNAITDVGFTIGYGSYSDISELDFLGCSFLNIGVGYYDYHSKKAFARTSDLLSQMDKFIKFYNLNKDTIFDYTKTTIQNNYSNYIGGNYSNYYSSSDDYWQKEYESYFGDTKGTDKNNNAMALYVCDYCKTNVEIAKEYLTYAEMEAIENKLCISCYAEIIPDEYGFQD